MKYKVGDEVLVKCKVIAWRPLPKPYQMEGESHE